MYSEKYLNYCPNLCLNYFVHTTTPYPNSNLSKTHPTQHLLYMSFIRHLHTIRNTLKHSLNMPTITLIHNPNCSKSRAALELLESKNITPNVVQYLDTPLSEAEIRSVVQKLGVKPFDLLRRGEPEYTALNLSAPGTTPETHIMAMATHPNLIERPILIVDDKAVIGRPIEKLDELIDELPKL